MTATRRRKRDADGGRGTGDGQIATGRLETDPASCGRLAEGVLERGERAATDAADGSQLKPGDTWTHPETGAKYAVVLDAGDLSGCDACAFDAEGDCPFRTAPVRMNHPKGLPPCHPDVSGGEGWHFECLDAALSRLGREDGAGDAVTEIPAAPKLQMVPLALVEAAPWQTRKTFGADSLKELAESIKRHGLMHPVTVVGRGGNPKEPFRYLVVAGERRVRACLFLGMEQIPAMVVDADDDEAREMCVVENMQRRNLAPLEEAAGVGALLAAGRSAKDVADRLGRTVKWVARRANLLNLSEKVKERLADPESPLAQAPLEALELAATMPAAWQDKVLIGFGAVLGAPSVQYVRGRIAAEMMDLKQAQFDTGDCQACEKRTGCQPDLFDGAEKGLGRCLDRGCFEALARAALEKRIEQARREHPGAVFATESYEVRRDHPDLKDKWQLDIAKQAGEDTVEGYLVLESGKLRKIHIRQPKRDKTAEGELQARQPTAEQKRRAKVVEAVGKLLEESMEARPCPFERLGAEAALRYVSQFGMHHRQNWRDGTDWEELRHGDLADILCITWRHCVPVFESRIRFDAIIRVDEAYDEACKVARELLDVSDPDGLAG